MNEVCFGETMSVDVEGEPGGHYGDLLADAMQKVEQRTNGAIIHRDEDELPGERDGREHWVLACAHSHVPEVGTKLSGRFTFQRLR